MCTHTHTYTYTYTDFMLQTPDKDMYIDAIFVEFFDRYARGNKPYYSAGSTFYVRVHVCVNEHIQA